ncbi:hypothetical protein Plhal304r1_c015g0056181 [Plasmopara halstedii]
MVRIKSRSSHCGQEHHLGYETLTLVGSMWGLLPESAIIFRVRLRDVKPLLVNVNRVHHILKERCLHRI